MITRHLNVLQFNISLVFWNSWQRGQEASAYRPQHLFTWFILGCRLREEINPLRPTGANDIMDILIHRHVICEWSYPTDVAALQITQLAFFFAKPFSLTKKLTNEMLTTPSHQFTHWPLKVVVMLAIYFPNHLKRFFFYHFRHFLFRNCSQVMPGAWWIKATLVHAIHWCHEAINHNPNQYWFSCMWH